MRIGEHAGELRRDEEVAAEGDFFVERVRESGGAGDGIVERGEIILAEDGEAGAGATEGFPGAEVGVERGADGRVFPVGDVFRLIAAGEEDAVGAGDAGEDARVVRGGGVVEADAFDGIDAADFGEDVVVVTIGAGRAQDDDIAAAGAGDEPFPRGGDIAAAAREEEAGTRFGGRGIGLSSRFPQSYPSRPPRQRRAPDKA